MELNTHQGRERMWSRQVWPPKLGRPLLQLWQPLRWPKGLDKRRETHPSRSRLCFHQGQTRQRATSHSALESYSIAWLGAAACILFLPLHLVVSLLSHKTLACCPWPIVWVSFSTAGPCSSDSSCSCILVAFSGCPLWAFASFVPAIHKTKGTSFSFFFLWWACYAV